MRARRAMEVNSQHLLIKLCKPPYCRAHQHQSISAQTDVSALVSSVVWILPSYSVRGIAQSWSFPNALYVHKENVPHNWALPLHQCTQSVLFWLTFWPTKRRQDYARKKGDAAFDILTGCIADILPVHVFNPGEVNPSLRTTWGRLFCRKNERILSGPFYSHNRSHP